MRWQAIAKALDATLISVPLGMPYQSCAGCAGPVTGYEDSRPVICARCTARELGTTVYAMHLASEFHLSIKVVEARLQRFGPPNVSPKEWLTPRKRLRKQGG